MEIEKGEIKLTKTEENVLYGTANKEETLAYLQDKEYNPKTQEFNIPSASFKFHRFDAENLREIYDIVNSKELMAELDLAKGGFHETELMDNIIYGTWKDVMVDDVEVLKDGKVQRETFTKVEEAFIAVFKGFAITCGKPSALKICEFTLTKATGIEFRNAHIAPQRLLELSDHMTSIKAIEFDKIHHPVFRSVKLNGQIESMSDIAPFHEFVDNIKSIKGVMNTPEGVRSIKIDVTGKVTVTKKKEENLSDEFFMWLYNFIYGG